MVNIFLGVPRNSTYFFQESFAVVCFFWWCKKIIGKTSDDVPEVFFCNFWSLGAHF